MVDPMAGEVNGKAGATIEVMERGKEGKKKKGEGGGWAPSFSFLLRRVPPPAGCVSSLMGCASVSLPGRCAGVDDGMAKWSVMDPRMHSFATRLSFSGCRRLHATSSGGGRNHRNGDVREKEGDHDEDKEKEDIPLGQNQNIFISTIRRRRSTTAKGETFRLMALRMRLGSDGRLSLSSFA